MHTVGLHSALAIKRQRKRREELKRARERRYSSQSSESGIGGGASSCESPGSAVGSSDPLGTTMNGGSSSGHRKKRRPVSVSLLETNVVPPLGMLHVGIVFLVLGLFLIGSGLIPDDYTIWSQSITWWNELVFSGLCALSIGVFLIVLNHYLSRREEEELSSYVERQLNRSRSGKRLIKDEETGCMKTKREKRNCNNNRRCLNLALNTDEKNQQSPSDAIAGSSVFSPVSLRSPPPIILISPNSNNNMNNKTDLEKILEEDVSPEKNEEDYYYPTTSGANLATFNKDTMANGSISPKNAASRPYYYQQDETDRELVVTRYYHTHD